jgi:hypothetical protein
MGCARPARRFDALRARRERRSRTGLRRTGAPPSLSLSFRGPSPHPRTVPPGEPAGRTMLPLLGFRALRHVTERRTRVETGVPPPARVPRPGFLDPHRGFHRHPSRRPKASKRPWAFPFEAFSSVRSVLLSEPLPSCRSPRRIVAPPWGADGRDRLQGFVPGASSCGAHPCGHARRCLPGVPPSRAFSLPVPAHRFGRGASPFTRRGVTSTGHARPGVSRSGEIGWSLSGLPALLGSSAL